MKLWLWENFVDGKPEYLAFDNPFPIHIDSDDPQTWVNRVDTQYSNLRALGETM